MRNRLKASAAAALGATCLLAGAPAQAQAQDVSPAMQALQARSLAATCANCHGTDGHARGRMKALAGEPAAKMLDALADFRSGAARSTVMQQIVKGYSEPQLRLIADYFAAQKPSR